MSISPDELSQWIDRWAGPLRSWLRERCRDPDEIVQETFCRLMQQTRSPERIAAWLFRVAGNLVREEARRGMRRSGREQRAASAESQMQDPATVVLVNEARDAVEQLPVELREVVIARLWGELTLAETAEVLSVPLSTVHRRYEKAIELLRERLGDKPKSQGVNYVGRSHGT